MENSQKQIDSSNLLADFFTFKFMIMEVIAPVIFAISLFALICYCVKLMSGNFAFGFFALIGSFIILRVFFELIMVAFSILSTLRQIRDKLPEKKPQITLNHQGNQAIQGGNDDNARTL